MSSEQPRSWIAPYYPSFNGLRGVAILSVFLCHFGAIASPYLHPWVLWAGVDLFFVLSGFLITGILWEAKASPRYFRDFYIRRALRILPVYWGFFLFLALITPLVHPHYASHIWISVIFLQNLLMRGIVLGHIQNVTIINFKHGDLPLPTLWSLCVEEQFYAVWPLVVLFVGSRRRLFSICVVGTWIVLLLRCVTWAVDPVARRTGYMYNESYFRFDSLLVGAAVFLYLSSHRIARQTLRKVSVALCVTGCLAIVVAWFALGRGTELNGYNEAFQTVGYTLVAVVAAGVLLLSLDQTSRFSAMLRWKPLARLGKVSYGFYFFHVFFMEPAIHTFSPHLHGLTRLWILPGAFLLSYGSAELSFRVLESPFLRLKDRWAPIAHKSVPVPISV